jgi:tetratricopeptide (TPR) repeat protein
MTEPHGEWRDGDEWAEEARRHFENGRLADAEAALRQALVRNPDRPEWHFHLGRLLEQTDRAGEALESYLRCHELDPDAPEPLLAAAGATEAEGDESNALRLVEQAVSLDRRRDESHARRVALLVSLERLEDAKDAFYEAQEFVEKPVLSLIAMAHGLEGAGETARAAWCLREALRHDGDMPEVRTMYARCLARQGEHPKALQNYMHVLREDPGDIAALLGCADLLATLGRDGEAAEKLHRVVELEPANGRAHHMLGVLELRASRFDRAALEFELVLKLDPERTGVQLDLAEAQCRRGRMSDARTAMHAFLAGRAASDDQPTPPEAIARAAGLLMALGMWTDAATILPGLAEACADRADVWRALARARFESGDLDGGVAASERALGIEPGCPICHHNLALAALRRRDVAAAWRWVTLGLRAARTDEGLRRLRSRVLAARAISALRGIRDWLLPRGRGADLRR